MTSIEWLAKQLLNAEPNVLEWQKYILQAKEMHKQEMGNTWDAAIFRNEQRGYNASRTFEDFDEYYQETFKKDNN